LFAVAGLLLASIPRPESAAAAKPSLLREATYGWTYIWNRRGLLALLIYFGAVNFVVSIARVLLTPLVLDFSTVEVLGFLTSVSGVGFLFGSLVMAVWGGPRVRIRGVLGFGLLFGLSALLIGLRPSLVVFYAAVFCMYASVPVINACSQAIWQSKTPPDAQGRVFAVRWLVSLSAAPVAYLLAGVLVERVFEPLAATGAPVLKALGRGAGQGTGLVFIAAGLLMMLAQLGGYLFPRLRRVEMELPDVVPEANA
ncbi:MAG TPA: MFS transporter, partial [Pyrinomonadaceae bacterium]